MHPHRIPYTIIALGTIATLGTWGGAKGIVLPYFLSDLALAPAIGSAIFTASSVGSFIGSSGFAWLTSRFGLARVNQAGALLLLAITAAIMFLQLPPLLYPAFVLFGLGSSMVELSSTLPISIIYAGNQGGIMSLTHGFFGLGSLTGSMLAGLAMARGLNWRLPMALAAVLTGCWAFAYHRQPPLTLPPRAKGEQGTGGLLKDPLVWAATLALTAGVAAENGAGIWLATYLSQGKGLSPAATTLGATCFFLGFTASRLFGPLLSRLGSVRAVLLCTGIGAAGFAGLVLLPAQWFWLTFLAGMGVGIIFPTCLTLVAVRYQSRSNQVFSLMYGMANVAGISTGPALGLVVERGGGLTAAMWVEICFYVAVVLLIGCYGWATARQKAAATSPAA